MVSSLGCCRWPPFVKMIDFEIFQVICFFSCLLNGEKNDEKKEFPIRHTTLSWTDFLKLNFDKRFPNTTSTLLLNDIHEVLLVLPNYLFFLGVQGLIYFSSPGPARGLRYVPQYFLLFLHHFLGTIACIESRLFAGWTVLRRCFYNCRMKNENSAF